VYQFRLVQVVDGFSQGIVVAVTFIAHRRFDASLVQTFAVSNRHILRPAIRMMDQHIVALRLPVVQGLLKCIHLKVFSHEAALPPVHNPAGIIVKHKGHVLPVLEG
jgi:hypothetical protein